MQKMTKKDVAKVLKETAYNNYIRADLLINNYVIVYNEFDIISTFYIYYSEKTKKYSILYVNVISTSKHNIQKVQDLVNDLENKLNGTIPVYDYPLPVIKAVKQWYQHNASGISEDEVRKLAPSLVANIYLEWEGISGYSTYLEAIYNAKIH